MSARSRRFIELFARSRSKDFSILLISTEMPEVLGMCDRILVLREGEFVASFQRGEASQAQLLNAASRMRVAEPVS